MDETKTLQDGYTKLDNSVEKRKIKRQFLLICLALVLLFCGYSSMLLLQSSINIVDGLGTNATAVSYALSVVFGLFFAPFAARLAGAKWTLLGSELCYLFYVVANFYPKKWVIMLAAASVGIGEALFWVVIGIIFVHFGELYYKYTINRTKDSCVREFSGILFSTFQSNTIIGNTLVFIILHFLKDSEYTQNDVYYNTTSNSTASIMLQPTRDRILTENDRLFYCGANDCQNANVTQQNLEKYRPSNLVALYALISAFAAIMITGIVLQTCVTPHIPVNFVFGDSKLTEEERNMENKNEDDSDVRVEQPENKTSILSMWLNSVKDIFWRSLSLKQILLYPVTIYVGLATGFLYCEVTRAYISCVKGVSQVGICSIIYAAANGISSFASARLASKFTLHSVIGVVAVLDVFLYILCLFWIPTEGSSWIVYPLFVMFGMSIGTWNVISPNLYSETFTQNQDLSFTLWSAFYSIGFGTHYAWSTLICVREKLYVQIALLCTSIICLQILRYKMKSGRKQLFPKIEFH